MGINASRIKAEMFCFGKYWKDKKGNVLLPHFSGQLIFFSLIKNNN